MSLRSAAAAFAVAAAFLMSPAVRADPDALEGKVAPDVTLKTLDGKDVKLSDMKGSVVVLDFWATWCPPCRASLPHLQHLATDKARADKGLVVWAVNAREKADVVKKFLAANKLTFAVPMDAEGASMTQYQVQGIPTTIIVGRDGKVAKTFVGYGGDESAKEIDQAVDAALAKGKKK